VRDFEQQKEPELAEPPKPQGHFAGIDVSETAPAAPEVVNPTSAFKEVPAEPAPGDQPATAEATGDPPPDDEVHRKES